MVAHEAAIGVVGFAFGPVDCAGEQFPKPMQRWLEDDAATAITTSPAIALVYLDLELARRIAPNYVGFVWDGFLDRTPALDSGVFGHNLCG
jgi:hypothetical protein